MTLPDPILWSQELEGLGRSNTMGGLVGWKLTVQVDALMNVV